MGFALVPPRAASFLDDDIFRKALRAIAPLDEDRGRRVMTIKSREGASSNQAFHVDFSPTFEAPANKRSLDPAPYVASAETWATVTPIVLDRHLKGKGEARQEEAAKQIAAACVNIGLPEPTTVVVDKHSAFEGTVSALPSVSSPSWMRWRLPDSLASRQLTHAVIQFAEPVTGPVILCAGRFSGLGLCRRLN
jgi:CRISPR-associated protein Csb2